MPLLEFLYLALLIVGFCVAYVVLSYLFTFFFAVTIPRFSRKSIYSLAGIIGLALTFFIISYATPNAIIGNRILHAFGGGFLAFFICFRVARDSGIRITKFQFFVFSFLVVTALGVLNEIIEGFLQHYSPLVFASTINDTWLDLFSNTVGALIGGTLFTRYLDR